MSGTGAPPAASPSRTIYVDGRPVPPGARAWPNMSAGDTLDYAIDYSGWLQDAFGGAAGQIDEAAIGVSIVGDGQLGTVSQTLAGAALIFVLTGGTPGQRYVFTITISTTNAPPLTLVTTASLTINPEGS